MQLKKISTKTENINFVPSLSSWPLSLNDLLPSDVSLFSVEPISLPVYSSTSTVAAAICNFNVLWRTYRMNEFQNKIVFALMYNFLIFACRDLVEYRITVPTAAALMTTAAGIRTPAFRRKLSLPSLSTPLLSKTKKHMSSSATSHPGRLIASILTTQSWKNSKNAKLLISPIKMLTFWGNLICHTW